ncbi:MAG: hemerythrin domain-containing protein [Muribaculaceae bacterium]|nr:hemerythrin domain-containing protein [Muribaculaceae bacterium]
MNHRTIRRFTESDSMTELVEADFNILPILSRFSIPLGFYGKTIKEVCEAAGIDTGVFLLIVNLILTGQLSDGELSGKAVMGVVDFLQRSHTYFLGYKFPHIRANLISALDAIHSDINPAIIRFFDDYVDEVRKHFAYEESTVFPYIRQLADGCVSSSDFRIEVFSKHHDEMGEKLADLKSLILRFYTTSVPDRMYDALVDIFNCEEDLDTHRDIENHILIPGALKLEKITDL